MKKLLAVIAAAAMLLQSSAVMAAKEADYTAEIFRSMGETLFMAPAPGDTTIHDKPAADYRPGWSVDDTFANVNYTRYNIFGDYVVQFYKGEKASVLSPEQSFLRMRNPMAVTKRL